MKESNAPEHMTAALNSAASTTGEYVSPLPEIPAHVEQELHQGATLLRQVDAAVAGTLAPSVALANVAGQVQALNYMHKLSGLGITKMLKDMKESGQYKGATIQNTKGELVTVTSFEDLCNAVGISYRKAAEDIQNLNVLGEEFMESAQNMGLGYRQIRQLRQLPEEDRAKLLAEGDPEDLKDALADALAEKAKAEKAAKDAVADKQAVEKVLSDKSKRLDSTTTELVKMKNLTPDEAVLAQGEKERTALAMLHKTGLELMGCFTQYLGLATTIVEHEDIGHETREQVTTLTSGMCSTIAGKLLEAGIDVDFRILTYPLALGEIDQRGMDTQDSQTWQRIAQERGLDTSAPTEEQ